MAVWLAYFHETMEKAKAEAEEEAKVKAEVEAQKAEGGDA